MKPIRIVSRKSPLAMCQANIVCAALKAIEPTIAVEIIGVSTSGDNRGDAPGDKSDFTKELELQLLAGDAELAVHSMKDVPVQLPEGLEISAVIAREDAHDALLSRSSGNLHELPANAKVGTSSLRRQCQLRSQRPDLRVSDLRGNIGTRIGKLDDGDYDAIVLAVAGLNRMGLHSRISAALPVQQMIPAIGQGAIGIESRTNCADSLRRLVQSLRHRETELCLHAERTVGRLLGADCRLPVAAHASLDGERMTLVAMVADPDSLQLIHASANGMAQQPDVCATQVVDSLRRQGADAVLERIKQCGGS